MFGREIFEQPKMKVLVGLWFMRFLAFGVTKQIETDNGPANVL
jgi:hypothetical protein